MEKTMNTTQLAEALGKPDRTVRDWVKSLAAKSAVIAAKIAVSSSSYPACWTVAEACEIIAEGMGAAAASVYRTNAAQAELDRQKAEADKVPSPKALNASLIKGMRSLYGDTGAAARIDQMYGFKNLPFSPPPLLIESSRHGPRVTKADLTYDQGIVALDAMRYPVSGEALAKFLKVSRSTVWRQATDIGLATRKGRYSREEAGKLWQYVVYGGNPPE